MFIFTPAARGIVYAVIADLPASIAWPAGTRFVQERDAGFLGLGIFRRPLPSWRVVGTGWRFRHWPGEAAPEALPIGWHASLRDNGQLTLHPHTNLPTEAVGSIPTRVLPSTQEVPPEPPLAPLLPRQLVRAQQCQHYWETNSAVVVRVGTAQEAREARRMALSVLRSSLHDAADDTTIFTPAPLREEGQGWTIVGHGHDDETVWDQGSPDEVMAWRLDMIAQLEAELGA